MVGGRGDGGGIEAYPRGRARGDTQEAEAGVARYEPEWNADRTQASRFSKRGRRGRHRWQEAGERRASWGGDVDVFKYEEPDRNPRRASLSQDRERTREYERFEQVSGPRTRFQSDGVTRSVTEGAVADLDSDRYRPERGNPMSSRCLSRGGGSRHIARSPQQSNHAYRTEPRCMPHAAWTAARRPAPLLNAVPAPHLIPPPLAAPVFRSTPLPVAAHAFRSGAPSVSASGLRSGHRPSAQHVVAVSAPASGSVPITGTVPMHERARQAPKRVPKPPSPAENGEYMPDASLRPADSAPLLSSQGGSVPCTPNARRRSTGAQKRPEVLLFQDSPTLKWSGVKPLEERRSRLSLQRNVPKRERSGTDTRGLNGATSADDVIEIGKSRAQLAVVDVDASSKQPFARLRRASEPPLVKRSRITRSGGADVDLTKDSLDIENGDSLGHERLAVEEVRMKPSTEVVSYGVEAAPSETPADALSSDEEEVAPRWARKWENITPDVIRIRQMIADAIQEDLGLVCLQFSGMTEHTLEEISPQIKELVLFDRFEANNNCIQSLSVAFCQLLRDCDVTFFNLSCNRMQSFTSHLCDCTSLQVIDLSWNCLESVPEDICRLNNLVVLQLKHNALTELPRGLGKLSSLQILNVSHNRLKELPNDIATVDSKLVVLDITFNRNFGGGFPLCAKQMKHLTDLHLHETRLNGHLKARDRKMGAFQIAELLAGMSEADLLKRKQEPLPRGKGSRVSASGRILRRQSDGRSVRGNSPQASFPTLVDVDDD